MQAPKQKTKFEENPELKAHKLSCSNLIPRTDYKANSGNANMASAHNKVMQYLFVLFLLQYILPNIHNLSLCFVKVMSSVELIPAFEIMTIGIIYLSV
jgi:hypothetical protein